MKKLLLLLISLLLLSSCAPKGISVPWDTYVACLGQDVDTVVETVEESGIQLNQERPNFWKATNAVKYKDISMHLLLAFGDTRELRIYTMQYDQADTKESRTAAMAIYEELVVKYGEPSGGTLLGYDDWDTIWEVFSEEAKTTGNMRDGVHFTILSAGWTEACCRFEIDLYEDNSRLEIRVQYHVPDIEANNE